MSGPPYPHPDPIPGSNALGLFVLGKSPLGTIPPFDFYRTIISQYGNSTRIMGIISRFFAALDQTGNIDNLFDLVRNVDTAVGWGLDVWGRIVGVSRNIQIPDDSVQYIRWNEASPSFGNFSGAIWYSGQPTTTTVTLSDAGFRTLILAKALANITDGSIKGLNRLLLQLFPNRGNAYVIDNNDMTMTYRFEFTLTPVEEAIVRNSGVLPKPTGVAVSYSIA